MCRRLQAAGWTLLHVRQAWSAVSHGRTSHLNVPDLAYNRAKTSGITNVTVQTWPKGGTHVNRPGILVGLTQHVAYVEVTGITVTFSLHHGRACYGSQQRFKGRLSPDDCAALLGAVGEVDGLEKRILEALGHTSLRLRSLQDVLKTSKTTLHHALKRLLYRKLITRSIATPHTYRRTICATSPS